MVFSDYKMSIQKFLTLHEIEEVLRSDEFNIEENDELQLDIVQLPPENVDCISDEEEFDDNDLDDGIPKDVPGELELHVNSPTEQLPPENVNCISDVVELDKKPKWKRIEPTYTNEYPKDSITCSNNIAKIKEDLKSMSAVDIFELFFDKIIFTHIVDQSIIFSKQKNQHSFTLSIECLKKFIGIMILTGYHSLPQEHMYWCEDDDVNVEIVRKCMSKNRYLEIKKFLHFNNNDSIHLNETDKLFKIRPLLTMLNKTFMQFGIFSKHLSIDEQMVRYYGHHYLKQFIKGKPVRFGFKQWVMACSQTGYCYKMEVYEGKRTSQHQHLTGVGERVVDSMVSIIPNPEECEVYFDSFFSSHRLMSLLKKKNLRATGTVQINRMNKCPIKIDKDLKKEKRGFYDYQFDTENEIFSVIWKDNNYVKVITNHQTLTPLNTVKRYSKQEKKMIDINMPQAICQYNKFMGGVDKLDWHVQHYRIKIRGKKWYFPLFTNMIDVALYNAFVLYNTSHEKVPYLAFKRMIARNYLQISSISDPKNKGRPTAKTSQTTLAVKRPINDHVLERTHEGKQRKCCVCKKNARKQCRACDKGIHVHCFEIYNS